MKFLKEKSLTVKLTIRKDVAYDMLYQQQQVQKHYWQLDKSTTYSNPIIENRLSGLKPARVDTMAHQA